MRLMFRIGSLAASLLAVVSFTNGSGGPAAAIDQDQQSGSRHLSGLMAKVTMRDGATRTVKLEGVGCARSICSRTAFNAKLQTDSRVRTWFDSLAAIKDITASDALFVLKDGTSRRMSLVNDFRVLYLANSLGGTDRLDLAKVNALEFLRRDDSAEREPAYAKSAHLEGQVKSATYFNASSFTRRASTRGISGLF